MGRQRTPACDRVLRRVDITSGCWVFQGCKNWDGYGMVKNPDGSQLAHVAVYEELIGPVPAGLELDHLCRNEPCVNPYHLDEVTRREHSQRGTAGDRQRARTHCPKGHPYDEQNTLLNHYANSSSGQKRACRTCVNARRNRRYHARKAAKHGS